MNLRPKGLPRGVAMVGAGMSNFGSFAEKSSRDLFVEAYQNLTGLVELEDGLKISARILDLDAKNPASIQPGLPLLVDFIETGEGEQHTVYLAFGPA
jgi:hypothetical protein